jgi:GntR family carbon starvation induced transcriptional regulator
MNKELSSETDKQGLEQLPLPPTRADWVEQQLRRDILSGEFAPGERLLAATLVKRYAVSPTPLREALQRLATDGLITMTPQRGVRVAPVSLRSAREIYELRCLLEPLALSKSLLRVDAEWREKVQHTYFDFMALLDDEQHDLVATEDRIRAFHQALLSRCDSRWLLNIVAMLSDHCIRYRLLSFKKRGGREGVLEEHRAIYEACMNGDSAAAAQALERHIMSTFKGLMAILEEAGTQEEDD